MSANRDPQRIQNPNLPCLGARPVLVNLVPGADREDLIRTLQAARDVASHLRGAGGNPADVFNSYTKWAIKTIRDLRRQIDETGLDQAVRSRTYWTLMGLGLCRSNDCRPRSGGAR